jgi:hypothetical protein
VVEIALGGDSNEERDICGYATCGCLYFIAVDGKWAKVILVVLYKQV